MVASSSDSSHALNEFVQHPDIRTISTFFLGWTFFLAIQYLIVHVWQNFVPPSIRGGGRAAWNPALDIEEKSQSTQGSPTSVTQGLAFSCRACKILVLLMNLSIAASAIGTFVSLLGYSESNAVGSCAFAVAWSGLTGQAVRSIGFAKLVCNLKQLHIGKLEYWALWIGILASIASSFVIQGVGGGFTEPIPQIPGLVLCYKSHPLVPAIVNGAVNITMELYLLTRIYILIVPEFLRAKHRREALRDTRLGCALSLLVLDSITVIPDIVCLSVAADSIPFALGAVGVLMAFNYRPPVPTAGVSPIMSSANDLPFVDGSTAPTVRSIRSSRSALPGDGGYGFESNIKLRGDRMVPPSVPPLSRRVSGVPSVEEIENKVEVDITAKLDQDPDMVERSYTLDQPSRRATDLPRLIIPNVAVRPIRLAGIEPSHSQNFSKDSTFSTSSDPTIRLLPRPNLATMRIGIENRRPIPSGPRPLPKLTIPATTQQAKSAPMARSAPAGQTTHAVSLTPIVVSSNIPENDAEFTARLSPIASSAGYPISRAASTSHGDKTPSSTVAERHHPSPASGSEDRGPPEPSSGPGPRPPSRYRYINARSDFAARQQSAPMPVPQPGESIAPRWRSVLQTAALTPPAERPVSEAHDRLSVSTYTTRTTTDEDGSQVFRARLSVDPVPSMPPARANTFGSSNPGPEAARRSLYALNFGHAPSPGDEFDLSSHPYSARHDRSRRASTVGTNGAPLTASSVSTFEIVQIPGRDRV